MANEKPNLFNITNMPNEKRRQELRKNYSEYFRINQVSFDVLNKYASKKVKIEFLGNFDFIMSWISETNYDALVSEIPLYSMLDTYDSIKNSNLKGSLLEHYKLVFYYHSEIVAYKINCAFEKSVWIFNALFELQVNDGHNAFSQIIKKINNKSKPIIRKVSSALRELEKNEYYKKIRNIRNLNTHSYRVGNPGVIEFYYKDKGYTEIYRSEIVEPDDLVEVTLGAIKVLNNYISFIERIIEEYYDNLYQKILTRRN